jgi:hypothetical protein
LGTPTEAPQSVLEDVTHFLGSPTGILTGIALTLAVGVIATIWPMVMGLRAFRKLEF